MIFGDGFDFALYLKVEFVRLASGLETCILECVLEISITYVFRSALM